jgi:NADPH:quinone reductase-like Zn-dependent oxidoreductase
VEPDSGWVDMRAAYYDAFGGPQNVQVGVRPDPVPDSEHMLVRTGAAGVGIWDVGILSSTVGLVVPPGIPGGDAPLPRIPGFEVAGTVEVAAGGFGTGARDGAVKLVRKGGRAIFIAFGAQPPPAPEGVEVQSFGSTINSRRLQAVAELVSAGKLRMPIEAELPLERAREALEQVGGRHTQGRVVLNISG